MPELWFTTAQRAPRRPQNTLHRELGRCKSNHPPLRAACITDYGQQDHDAIDFTDNDIAALSNFPLSPRLRTLLLARNRVSTFSPTLARSIPNLTTLVLTGNRVAELADLDVLGGMLKLTHLVLLENPVCAREVSAAPAGCKLCEGRG